MGFVGNIGNPEYVKYKGFDVLKKACEGLGVELKTALYGKDQLPHNEMREGFYSKISCLVMPTKGEGCNNCIMEALALGIPVITTETAGFHGEMLTQGKNVLFCERTVESIKHCIGWLRKDRRLHERLSREGRKFAEEHHDIKKVAAEYEKIINACHEFNKNHVPRGDVNVKVKVIQDFVEERFYRAGEIMDTTEKRAAQLKGYVETIEPPRIIPSQPVQKVVTAPVKDKMIREPIETKESGFKCDICGFVSKSKAGLSAHKRRKHGGK